MIIDARELPPHRHELETELCIIGSGPAALTVCREVLSTGARIMLLESGARHYDAASQELNAGHIIGGPYDDLRRVRRRQIGGTVNIWNTEIAGQLAAKYVPLDPIDFEARDWLPHSGWPFGSGELDPWYVKAQTICGLGPLAYDADDWAEPHSAPLRLEDGFVTTGVYQFGKATPFLDTAVRQLDASPDVELVQHATVTGLLTEGDGDRVNAALFAVPGRSACVRVRAHRFVLAAGAIENARLLLLSSTARREGLGNEHDNVGRFLMEHPRDYAMTLMPKRRTFFEEAGFYDQRASFAGVVIMGRLAFSADALRETRSLQASATLLPATHTPSMLERTATRVLRRLRGEPVDYPRSGTGWSMRPDAAEVFTRMRLLLNLEQAPAPRNRIVLSREHDPFGQHKVEMHWSWTDTEQQRLERTRRRFAAALEGAGYGTVHINDSQRPDANAHHHAGTTRMHTDPRMGVVDADCRVHGIENLFIAGASVFPTAGFANPTLSIVALAARLGDHLRRQWAS